MGCDIHLYVERRTAKLGSVDVWSLEDSRPISDRNYDAFAILANVRNGEGFAGIKTGGGFKPIAMPRGLPEDVSVHVRAEAKRWGADGHSHSWLTLAEIQAYDWTQVAEKQGMVSVKQYLIFKEKGRPEAWATFVMGPNIHIIEPDEMERRINTGEPTGGLFIHGQPAYYTTVKWTETYAEAMGSYLDYFNSLAGTIPQPLAEIRVVFWFDN